MSPKELLLQEIEQAPDGLLTELLNLLRLLKPRYSQRLFEKGEGA